MQGCRKNPMIVARMVQGEGFLVPLAEEAGEMRRIFKLNDLGWYIWQNLDRVKDLRGLAALLSREFEVEEPLALKDAGAFLAKLAELGALELEEEAPHAPPNPDR